MTILYDHQIFSSQPQGGVSRYFAELLQGAARKGVTTNKGWKFSANRYLQKWDPNQYRDWLPQMPFRGKAHLTGLFNRAVSTRMLRASAWSVFHPTYFDPYFLPLLKGRPFVLTIHDMTHELYPDGLSDRRTLPGRKRLLAHAATRVIAVSENTRQDAIRILGLDSSKVVAIPHGNSLRPGAILPQMPSVTSPYWLYVGSRGAYKNWSVVVEALVLRNNNSDRLVLVGGGALTPSEQNLLARGGLSNRVQQVSASDSELAGWYAGAAALVYPSRYEGFGMPLLEAMAWGCPVIAARASCFPEIGGEAVLYFDPEDSKDLVRVLDQLSDPAIRQSQVDRGRLREAEFSWDRAVDRTLAVYEDCT